MADKTKPLSQRFAAEPGKTFVLSKRDPRDASTFKDKDQAKAQTEADAAAIDALQDRLFAEGKRALLVVLQGIDCSGKDGTVRAVFNTCGPIGVKVASFKAPTSDELAQDFDTMLVLGIGGSALGALLTMPEHFPTFFPIVGGLAGASCAFVWARMSVRWGGVALLLDRDSIIRVTAMPAPAGSEFTFLHPAVRAKNAL